MYCAFCAPETIYLVVSLSLNFYAFLWICLNKIGVCVVLFCGLNSFAVHIPGIVLFLIVPECTKCFLSPFCSIFVSISPECIVIECTHDCTGSGIFVFNIY